ncbi:MAG: ferritin-like domain-containing protein [Actinomycetota bacterium]|nr:ferritin-like domain-containing protein [Actinomycetota bacterium]
MKRQLSPDELARDARFQRVTMSDRLTDPRTTGGMGPAGDEAKAPRSTASAPPARQRGGRRIDPSMTAAPDVARSMMHGIFVGEIQALEGAGRTCFDFDTGTGDQDVPFELKLDMARQCWDEARHVEISCKLADFMGTEIGEFGESTILFEAACNADPVLRLAGVNRALEGLAIDVFNTMREFGEKSGDPVLAFCEDWMLADEVTHVKMGSDWLRRLTVNDPDRRARALEFQRVVDKLFSYGGIRGDDEQSPVRLARRFRELAGFDAAELDEIGDLSREAAAERRAAAGARRRAEVA